MSICWVILQRTVNIFCYTSTTMTTLKFNYIQVSFLYYCPLRRFTKMFAEMWEVYSLLLKCERCTHSLLSEILYFSLLFYIFYFFFLSTLFQLPKMLIVLTIPTLLSKCSLLNFIAVYNRNSWDITEITWNSHWHLLVDMVMWLINACFSAEWALVDMVMWLINACFSAGWALGLGFMLWLSW